MLYKEYKDLDGRKEWLEDMEEKLKAGVKNGIERGFIKKESIVVLLSGWVPGPEHINTIRITTVRNINASHMYGIFSLFIPTLVSPSISTRLRMLFVIRIRKLRLLCIYAICM